MALIDRQSILAAVLGLDPSDLDLTDPDLYHAFTLLPKRPRRKPRDILAPCDDLKRIQRAILVRLLSHVVPHAAATAFAKGRSIAENAQRHHGCLVLYKTDIRDFFGSITAGLVTETLARHFPHLTAVARAEIARLCLHKGVLPQGAPTSPHLANLVLFDFDVAMTRHCAALGATYTRYADDIAVSAHSATALEGIGAVITQNLGEWGLALHPGKTRLFGPHERKIVTGLDVTAPMIRPPRAFRKKTAALVRMCELYPHRTQKHGQRISGYLAFWHGVAPADPELFEIWRRLASVSCAAFRKKPPATRLGILGSSAFNPFSASQSSYEPASSAY